MSDSEIEQKEQEATLEDLASDFSPEEQEQFSRLGDNDSEPESDQVGKGFTGKGKPKGKFWSRRKKTSGGIIGLILGLLIGGSTIFGPGLTVNHLRSLLIEKVGQLQIDHTRKYRRKKLSKVTDLFTKDGRRGGKIIAEMETRGYRFKFDPSDNKKIVGLTLPDGRTSLFNADNGALADHIDKYMEVHHPLRTSRWKTKRMEAFYTRYKVSRKAVTTRTLAKIEDPEVETNKRMVEQIDDTGTDTTVRNAPPDKNETDAEKTAREQRVADDAFVAKNDGSLKDIKAKLKEGVPIKDLSDEEQKILKVASRVDNEVMDLLNNIGSGSLAGKAFGTFKGIASSTDVLDKICTAKNRLRAISFAARNYRALSLIRYASVFIKAGDDVRRGTVDPKLMNELMKRVTENDSNGNSIGGSPGFAYILKNKFSRSKNDVSKSNVNVNGTQTGVVAALQGATDQIPAVSKNQCGVYQNPGFQIGVAAVEVGVAIFTGGTSEGVEQGSKEAVVLALKEALKSIITKETAKGLAKQIAIDLTFEGALTLLQFYAEKATTLNFTGQEKGGELGDILTAGAGTMNKQRGLQSGMVPATDEQYAAANTQFIAEKKADQKTQSFYTRVFDYNNLDSVAYQTASKIATMPYGVEGAGTLVTNSVNMAVSILSKPFAIFGSLGGVLSGNVSALNSDEIPFETYNAKGKSLATDPAGNLLPVMRDDILNVDPEENVKFLINSGDIDPTTYQPVSGGRFEEHVKNCVEGVDTISVIENEDQTDPQYDCLATQAITVRFKAHLAWLDMQDGLDAYLFPEEIATDPSTTSTTTTTAEAPPLSCTVPKSFPATAQGGGMTYVNWNFNTPSINSLKHEIDIKNDPGANSNEYLQLYDANIDNTGQYYGLQTTGMAIFSRFGTVDKSNVVAGPGSTITSGTNEGPFISLRHQFGSSLPVGHYSTRMVRARFDGRGDWFDYFVTLPGKNESYIGSIRFPRANPNTPASYKDGGGTWTEFWDNNATGPLKKVPLWHTVVGASANGSVGPASAISKYSAMPNSDVYALAKSGPVDQIFGGLTPRCHPAGALW